MGKLKREKRKQLLYWTDLLWLGMYLLCGALCFYWVKPHVAHGTFQVLFSICVCAPPMFGLATFMTRIAYNDAENVEIDLNNKLIDIGDNYRNKS